MTTICLIAHNEAKLLPYTVAFYRARFPKCAIIIYDNFSKDNTAELARSLGREVKQFYRSGKLRDQAFINIKNNCREDAKTEWVIICYMDEWIDITENDLLGQGYSVFKSIHTDRISIDDFTKTEKMVRGVIHSDDGKSLCFNRTKRKEIKYDYGCHTVYRPPVNWTAIQR